MYIKQSVRSTHIKAKRINVFFDIKIMYTINELYYRDKNKFDNRSKLIRAHGLGTIQSGFTYAIVGSKKRAYSVENYKKQIWLLVNPFCTNSKTFRFLLGKSYFLSTLTNML